MIIKKFILSLFIFLILYTKLVLAITYQIPHNGSRLVGKNIIFTIPKDNKLPLEHFAAKYQLGLSNIIEANPGIDPYLPKGGTLLNIPHQLILPDTIHKGIIINSAEMRLYFYPKKSNLVIVFPIGIGQIGNVTPLNWKTNIKSKKYNPIWIPTKKIRDEYLAAGELLPKVVPAGLNNPMGLYALYVGNMYAIHGTNSNFGIGLRISHGCVRLRNEDIKFLFKNVSVGTFVQFINEPVKLTTEPDGNNYIEVHNPLSTSENQIKNNEVVPIILNRKISNIIKKNKNIDLILLKKAIKNRTGMPIRLN